MIWSPEVMRTRLNAFLVILLFVFLGGTAASAQDRRSLRNGESIDLGILYWVSQCRSIAIGTPEVEILEGPAEVSLTVREEMVLPRRLNCPKKVQGGTLVLTAKDVTEPIQARLTYRVKYKTKDGDRQTSNVYNLSLFP
jgi:hypothetical protein